MTTALAADQPSPVSEETPRTSRGAADLIGLREPALINRKERDNAFPNLLPVL
jgi:hypothetical protein